MCLKVGTPLQQITPKDEQDLLYLIDFPWQNLQMFYPNPVYYNMKKIGHKTEHENNNIEQTFIRLTCITNMFSFQFFSMMERPE